MNDADIVKKMIAYVEQEEKDSQAAKLGNAAKSKSKAVTDILKELEREIKNADKEH